jgi:type IV pilus assembly protein PilA
MLNAMKSALGGKNLRKGFTLIELLVVIAIIGILATIVIINVAGARTKAIDTKAFADLQASAKIGSMCSTDNLQTAKPASGATAICPTSSVATGNWPDLTTAKGYGTWAYSAVAGDCKAATANGATDWALKAVNTTNTNWITGGYTGASKSGF